MVVELTAVCTRLSEKGILYHDTVHNILKGLAIASHPGFSKLFSDFGTAIENDLMGSVVFNGTIIEKVVQIFDSALSRYTSLCLSNEWMEL